MILHKRTNKVITMYLSFRFYCGNVMYTSASNNKAEKSCWYFC